MAAIPEETVTRFCSATPISINLFGNFSANKFICVDSVKSAQRATTFLSASPAKSKPCPKPFRVGACSQSWLKIFGFNFNFGLSIL